EGPRHRGNVVCVEAAGEVRGEPLLVDVSPAERDRVASREKLAAHGPRGKRGSNRVLQPELYGELVSTAHDVAGAQGRGPDRFTEESHRVFEPLGRGVNAGDEAVPADPAHPFRAIAFQRGSQ